MRDVRRKRHTVTVWNKKSSCNREIDTNYITVGLPTERSSAVLRKVQVWIRTLYDTNRTINFRQRKKKSLINIVYGRCDPIV